MAEGPSTSQLELAPAQRPAYNAPFESWLIVMSLPTRQIGGHKVDNLRNRLIEMTD